MAQEQEHDRSEPATPFKLEEARRRGQVAKSAEFAAWLMLLAAVLLGRTLFDQVVSSELRLSRALFDQAGRVDLTVASIERLFASTGLFLASAFGVTLVIITCVALLGGFIQIGPVFSAHPLKPDFTRLNPVTGFKRVFNARMLYEFAKTLIKLALVSVVLYLCIRSEWSTLMTLPHTNVRLHPHLLHGSLMDVAIMVLVVLGFIAVIDLGYVKWEFARKMRMSRREVKEEVKRRDGDPKVKAKIRELQREAARRGASLKRVPDADVLITNPTHLSIAVRYERGRTAAPIVLAKGSGEMALRMRTMAHRARVPVIENRPLARLLFRVVPIDAPVPPETYPDVARILAWAYRLRARSA